MIGCSYSKNKCIIHGIFKKERWNPFGGDGSYGIISTDAKKYIKSYDNIIGFIESLNYRGPFSIEFACEKGIDYFLEINLRNDGTSHYFHKIGLYIPYLYYYSIIHPNDKTDYPRYGDTNELVFIDEVSDFYNIVTGRGLSLRKWFYDIRHAQVYKYINRNDISFSVRLFIRLSIAHLYYFYKHLITKK